MVWAQVSLSSLPPTSVKQSYGKPSVQLQSTQAEVNTDVLIPFNVGLSTADITDKETLLFLCHVYICTTAVPVN